MSKSKYVGKESLGEALHVALRKGCDSAPTTAAHIAIGMMPDAIWTEYVKIIGRYFEKAKKVKKLDAKNAWEHLLYASVQEPSEASRRDRERAREKVGAWVRNGKFGPKPPYSIPYEPVSAQYYDPGACFAADRENEAEVIRALPKEDAVGSASDILRRRDRWRYLLRSILRTFSDDDWKGFACYLFYEEDK